MKFFIAKIFSIFLHPIILGVLLPFLVIYRVTTNFFYGIEWTIFSSLFIFASVFIFFLLHPKDFFSDFDVSKREKRPMFYAIFLFFAVIYFIVALVIKGLFFPMSIVSLGMILAIVMLELANFYLKVSIHATVVCSYIVTVGILYGFIAFLAVAWMPFAVGWSRVLLKKHTKREVFSGSVLGVLITLLTFAVGKLLM